MTSAALAVAAHPATVPGTTPIASVVLERFAAAEGLSQGCRDARDADVAEIAALYRHHVLHGVGPLEETPPSVDEMRRRFDTLALAGLPFRVACDGAGRIAGYACASPFHPREAMRGVVQNSIYVRPDLIGRGVGRRLLRDLIERCRADGLREIVAYIVAENLPSRALHARCGFGEVGVHRRACVKLGRAWDVVVMQRPLAPGKDA